MDSSIPPNVPGQSQTIRQSRKTIKLAPPYYSRRPETGEPFRPSSKRVSFRQYATEPENDVPTANEKPYNERV